MLLIDFGNSRLKWRLQHLAGSNTHGMDSSSTGVIEHQGEAASLEGLLTAFATLANPSKVLYSSVAEPGITAELERITKRRFPDARLTRVVSARRLGRITNGYLDPDALGVDRLLAMGGARQHIAEGALLVVSIGTATTIDYLDQQDQFQGGVILPGLRLMARALNQGTAQLPFVEIDQPEAQALGLDTVSGMRAGIVHAQCGAIERLLRVARQRSGDCSCVLGGGGAHLLEAELPFPIRLIDNLVLDGLAAVAAQHP
jgi:type III pantothenate kinase